MVLRHTYLLLFSLTLLAVIAGSSAVLALVGKGQDLLVFSLGAGIGMLLTLVLVWGPTVEIGISRWQRSRDHLAAMQQRLVETTAALQLAICLAELNPRLLLAQFGQAPSPRSYAADIYLELECRRLLDRVHQLLEKAVSEDSCCRYCERWGTHTSHCPVPAAQLLYARGKEKRVPWREYKKTLPQDVV